MTFPGSADRLAARWRLLALVALGSGLLGWLLSFAISPRYRATTKMLVVETPSAGVLGNLVNLSGSLGLGLDVGATSLALYAEYVLSRDLLDILAGEPLPLADGSETTLLARWGEAADEVAAREKAARRLGRALQVRTKPSAGVLEVTVEAFDPVASAHLARRLVAELNAFHADLQQWSGLHRASMLAQRLDDVQITLRAAEDSLTQFRMKNVDLSHPRLRLQEMRLLREISIQTEVLQAVWVQQEMARLQTKGSEPVLKVLQTAQPPLERTWPRRGRIAVLSAFAALVLCAYGVLARNESRGQHAR